MSRIRASRTSPRHNPWDSPFSNSRAARLLRGRRACCIARARSADPFPFPAQLTEPSKSAAVRLTMRLADAARGCARADANSGSQMRQMQTAARRCGARMRA